MVLPSITSSEGLSANGVSESEEDRHREATSAGLVQPAEPDQAFRRSRRRRGAVR